MTEKFLIDSNGWIEYFMSGAKSKEFKKYFRGNSSILASSITFAEVASRFHSAGRASDVLFYLAALRQKAEIVEISETIADEAGRLRIKHKLKLPDAIILASAVVSNAVLVTLDSDFKGIEGVVVV